MPTRFPSFRMRSVEQCIDNCLSRREEDAAFPVWAWRHDVVKGKTDLGYEGWLVLQKKGKAQ